MHCIYVRSLPYLENSRCSCSGVQMLLYNPLWLVLCFMENVNLRFAKLKMCGCCKSQLEVRDICLYIIRNYRQYYLFWNQNWNLYKLAQPSYWYNHPTWLYSHVCNIITILQATDVSVQILQIGILCWASGKF